MDVHRVRFIEHQPKAIHCLAFSDDTDLPRLAVSRSDSSLEVWASSDGLSYYQETWVPGREDSSVEALVWCQGRLFSAGLTGHVIEWDLERLRPRLSLDGSGGAVWCLVPNAERNVLAGGYEDGQVRLYDITAEGLQFMRSLDRQEERVLSLAWHPEGKHIAVGGADSTIRRVEVDSGRCVQRITTDDYVNGSTLVWDLCYLSDHTIVSADSLGKILFWNGKHGTLRQSIHLHKADVLTLALNAAENTIFASGVDALIIKLEKLPKEPSKWVKTAQSRTHTHDIRSLALSSTGLLASGGVDTMLGLCSEKELVFDDTIRNLPFQGSSRFFSVTPRGNVLMYQDDLSLKFWKMKEDVSGRASRGAESPVVQSSVYLNSDSASLDFDMPVHFLELKSKGPLHILTSAISHDGSMVAFSNVDELWFHTVELGQGEAMKVRQLYSAQKPCYKMAFSPDGLQVVMATINEGVKVMNLISHKGDNGSSSFKTTVLVSKKKHSFIVDLQVSQDGNYVATMSNRGRISVYDLASRTLLVKLPRIDGLPVVCCFAHEEPTLVLFSGRDREVFTYDFLEESLTTYGSLPFYRRFQGRDRQRQPVAIFPMPGDRDLFAVYDNDFIAVMRLSRENSMVLLGTKRTQKDFYPRFQNILFDGKLLYATPLAGGGLLSVERRWQEVIKRFPPTLMRDKYGT